MSIRNLIYRLSGRSERDTYKSLCAAWDELSEKRAEIESLRESRDNLHRENRYLRSELVSAKSITPEKEAILRDEIADLKFRLKGKQDEAMKSFREVETCRDMIVKALADSAVKDAEEHAESTDSLLNNIDKSVFDALTELGIHTGPPDGFPDRVDSLIRAAKEGAKKC